MYDKPPITESVIGISFERNIDNDDLDKLKSKLSKHYPNCQPIENIKLKVDLENKESKSANTDVDTEITYRLSNSDITELAILSQKNITISQLAPYPGWDAFFNRLKRDWEIAKRKLGYVPISRIGVRYINRIDVPCDARKVELEAYLNIYPKIPDSFGDITGYSVQTSIFLEDIKCNANIRTGAIQTPLLGHLSFLLDQDISRSGDVPQNNADIYELLAQIRHRKNELFESCITDSARSLFKNG